MWYEVVVLLKEEKHYFKNIYWNIYTGNAYVWDFPQNIIETVELNEGVIGEN